MKKFFDILLWIISFCFSGFLSGSVSDMIKENNWFSEVETIDSWLNTPMYTKLHLIVFVLFLGLFVFLGYTFNFYCRKYRSKKKENSPEEQLKQINSFVDESKNIKITWDVHFGTMYSNDPFASNIKIFCLNHNPPLLMENYGCLVPNCPNQNFHTTERDLRRFIESLLFAKYEELKNQKK